jgi:hypothetical protein
MNFAFRVGNNYLGELGISWKFGEFRPRIVKFALQGSAGTQVSVKGNWAIGNVF